MQQRDLATLFEFENPGQGLVSSTCRVSLSYVLFCQIKMKLLPLFFVVFTFGQLENEFVFF